MNVNKIKKASTSTRVNTFFMVSSVSFKSSSKENYDDFLLYFTVPFKATLTPKVFLRLRKQIDEDKEAMSSSSMRSVVVAPSV